MKTKQRIVLGMSGGVDSSVCAFLLQQQGYDVVGLFMQNWDEVVNYDIKGHIQANHNNCNAAKDYKDALSVGNKLNITVHYKEFIDAYWKEVFQYVVNEYSKGRTPNPDILCNKYIKFNRFIDYAKNELGIDKIAMGHYANVVYKNKQYYLVRSKDEHKDQTYFLCWLNQEQLSKTIFPLGKFTKDEVRKIAAANNFINWNKKDSTGICFIGERKFKEFLMNYIQPKKGDIVDVVTHKKIATHEGIMYYTIGQNRSLGLGGMNTKYFVCKKDLKNNVLYVCSEENSDEYLSSTQAILSNFNWINDVKEWLNRPVLIRFRHTGQLVKGQFYLNNGHVIINYEPTKAVAPGQFAVLYIGKICLGGGIIEKTNQK